MKNAACCDSDDDDTNDLVYTPPNSIEQMSLQADKRANVNGIKASTVTDRKPSENHNAIAAYGSEPESKPYKTNRGPLLLSPIRGSKSQVTSLLQNIETELQSLKIKIHEVTDDAIGANELRVPVSATHKKWSTVRKLPSRSISKHQPRVVTFISPQQPQHTAHTANAWIDRILRSTDVKIATLAEAEVATQRNHRDDGLSSFVECFPLDMDSGDKHNAPQAAQDHSKGRSKPKKWSTVKVKPMDCGVTHETSWGHRAHPSLVDGTMMSDSLSPRPIDQDALLHQTRLTGSHAVPGTATLTTAELAHKQFLDHRDPFPASYSGLNNRSSSLKKQQQQQTGQMVGDCDGAWGGCSQSVDSDDLQLEPSSAWENEDEWKTMATEIRSRTHGDVDQPAMHPHDCNSTPALETETRAQPIVNLTMWNKQALEMDAIVASVYKTSYTSLDSTWDMEDDTRHDSFGWGCDHDGRGDDEFGPMSGGDPTMYGNIAFASKFWDHPPAYYDWVRTASQDRPAPEWNVKPNQPSPESGASPPAHGLPHPAASTYRVTYWAKVESGDQSIDVPIHCDNVLGPEKAILHDDLGLRTVWKWMQDKGLDGKVGLQDAFDLAKILRHGEDAEVIGGEAKDVDSQLGGEHQGSVQSQS